MLKEKKNIIFIGLITIICLIILIFQIQKIGFHEDEMYTIASSVNPQNGLMTTIDTGLEWYTRDYVKDYVTLKPINIFNLRSVWLNQSYDNHPPLFYTAVHFASLLFGGDFSKYTVFIVNIVCFILSIFVIRKILKLLDKENLIIPITIFYGLSMGTISMVIFQRMYMMLTLFILLYFYYNLKIYKNNFIFDKKDLIKLGFIVVLGFLTQYFFAVYAIFVFLIMVLAMFIKKVNTKTILKYFGCHIIYAIIAFLIFPYCIRHLLYSDRGITNLGNGEYFTHFYTYLKHLAYAFSVNTNTIVISITLCLFLASLIYLIAKKQERFTIILANIPCVFFFIITVKMTSFRELRYIMPIIPFICISLFLVLDYIVKTKYKNVIIIGISVVLVSVGFIFSKPKFLFEDYKPSLEIAEKYKDLPFVYVYDNIFNHMQSVPEMMIYQKSVIINVNKEDKDEMEFIYDSSNFEGIDSFILCIKYYMDNEEIIEKIKNNTEFKKITQLHKVDAHTTEMISNNLYLVER